MAAASDSSNITGVPAASVSGSEHRRDSGGSIVGVSGRCGGVVVLREHRRDNGGSHVGAAYSAKTAEPHVYLTTIFGRQTGGDKKTFILWRYA